MTEIETEEPVTEGDARLVAGDAVLPGATVPCPKVGAGGPRDAEVGRLLERLDDVERLLAARADLVERRRVIMFGKARDDYAAAISRIDRLIAVRRSET